MITATQRAHIRTIHPFPARMAPSIIWDVLPEADPALCVLDPMSGSGTTLVCARSKGHHAIGCDTDPLALMISTAWCSNVDPERLMLRAKVVLDRAEIIYDRADDEEIYPLHADEETRQFIDFWFDLENRRQLNALSTCISRIRSKTEKTLLWCAFSRLIITKTAGASLAMDVSHSRPHRVYSVAPVKPFEVFLKAVGMVVKNAPFSEKDRKNFLPDIRLGDARNLPVDSTSIDIIITSPPYLNAIDYLRGHKLSLVWMGHNIAEIRALRSGNIGTEVSDHSCSDDIIQEAMESMVNLDSLEKRHIGMIHRYLKDMNNVIQECARVLKPAGKAVFVVGNSSLRGVFVKNSEGLVSLGGHSGLSLISKNTRPLESSRRYMPPPDSKNAGGKMKVRMREEVILVLRKST